MQAIPINDYNFIRWHAGSGESIPLSSVPAVNGPRLDLPVFKNQERCYAYAPVFIPNEPISFFINALSSVPIAPSEVYLGLLRGKDLVESDLPGLQGIEDTNDPGNYWLYHDNLLIPQQRNSRYRLVLYAKADAGPAAGQVHFYSNELEALDYNQAIRQTIRLETKNSRNGYGYYYKETEDAGNPFEHKIRLHIRQESFTSEANFKQYRAVNTGRLRNVKSEPDISYTLQTIGFDHDAHRAMSVLSLNDYISINGREYLTKEDYQANVAFDFPSSNGQWTVYEQAFSKINRYAGEVARSSDIFVRAAGDPELDGSQKIRIISDPT